MNLDITDFFKRSDYFDYLVTKQLSHINPNWELIWNQDNQQYEPEEQSFAQDVNTLIEELSQLNPPAKYHDHEDRLAEHCKQHLGWDIKKVGNRWQGHDYASILEQGGFRDVATKDLMLAASGRIRAAINRGQLHFDQMELFHQKMLADVLAIILYHRWNA